MTGFHLDNTPVKNADGNSIYESYSRMRNRVAILGRF